MKNKFGEGWESNPEYFSDLVKRQEIKNKSNREGKPFWEYMDFNHTIFSIVTKKNLWDLLFKEMFVPKYFIKKEELEVCANRVWKYRSDMIHKRSVVTILPKSRLKLIEAEYETLEEIVNKQLSEI